MTTETHHFSDFGSVNSYAREHGLDVHDPKTTSAYGRELSERKRVVAAQIGIDAQEFHLRPIPVAEAEEIPDN